MLGLIKRCSILVKAAVFKDNIIMVNQDQMPCIEVKIENERIDLDLTSLNIIKGLSGAERGHGVAGCRAGAPD